MGKRRAIRLVAALALAAAILATPATHDPPPPAADHWVSVQLEGGRDAPAGSADLEARGFRQAPVPAGVTPAAYSAWLETQPGVLSATPDGAVRAAAAPNDVHYDAQQPYYDAIRAALAWDIATDAREIVVAVLDTGIDLNHPDLQRNLWQNPDDADTNGIDDDGNGCIDDRYGCRFLNLTPERIDGCGYSESAPTGRVRDDHGGTARLGSHGTAVAGIIGALGDNDQGVTGVAHRVRLMTVKVLDCGPNGDGPGGEMAGVARGIDYARRMGADIINLSLASEPSSAADDIPAVRAAIEAALAEGIIIVASAGNHGERGVGFPAAYAQYENVIGVGAFDPGNGNTWPSFSSFGGGVDLAAPGVGIVTTIRTDLANQIDQAPYAYVPDATSFAAPLVTGVFALVMARNPDLSLEEYLAIVRESAAPAPAAAHGGNWAGDGLLDARAALERVPMTVSGPVLRDWMIPPAGTPVRALVGDVECGAGETTMTEEGAARYALRIAGENEIAGCGAIGREVAIEVGGLVAGATLPWGALNESLALEERAVNGLEAPPGAVVSQDLGEGWNLVVWLGPALAFPADEAALPEDWSAVMLWDAAAGRYRTYHRAGPPHTQTLTTLATYETIWVYSAGGTVEDANPMPAAGRRVELAAGWNTLVYTGTPRAVTDALATIAGRYNQVLAYDNVSGRWKSWTPFLAPEQNDFGGLYPLRVYLIRMVSPGTLVME